MATQQTTIGADQVGCWLDNHRGHYIVRDVVELAVGFGFIVGPFERFALGRYDDENHRDDYPHESLHELAEEAVEWLNSGQEECLECGGVPYDPTDPGESICRACSGTGRGPRVKGQNFPPLVPAGHAWEWNDGDFGLYPIEGEED